MPYLKPTMHRPEKSARTNRRTRSYASRVGSAVKFVGNLRRSARQLSSILLIITLLSTSAPAATPQVLSSAASSTYLGLALWLESSGWAATVNTLLTGQKKPKPTPEERQSKRDARVARLDISPGDVTLRMYERVIFAVNAVDAEGVPVGGVRYKWRAEHVERGRKAPISRMGEFEAPAPGTYKITVEARDSRPRRLFGTG